MVILLSITTREITIKEIESVLKNTTAQDFLLKIACEKNNKIVEEFSHRKKFAFPISLDIYPVGTCEEAMIENTVKNLPVEGLMLVRNDTPNFTANTIDRILAAAAVGNDVVMLKKRKTTSKIRKFFSELGDNICKMFFNFKHYEGDIGLQYFSVEAQNILKNTNVNLMSKLNRWLALDVYYVEMDIKRTKFPKKSFKKPLAKSIAYALVFVLAIALTIVFGSKINWTFITTLAFLFVTILSAAMSLFHALEIYNISRVGLIHFKQEDAIETRTA